MKKIFFSIVLLILLAVPGFSQYSVFGNITATSPSSPSTAPAAQVISGVGRYSSMSIYATIQGATGGVLDIYIQTSFDGGNTWYDYAHYAQLAAGAASSIKYWSVSAGSQQTTATTVGSGTSPALAANTIVGGAFGDQIRVLFVAGASTSAGASQKIDFFFTQ